MRSMYLTMQSKWNQILGAKTNVNESVNSRNGLNDKYEMSENFDHDKLIEVMPSINSELTTIRHLLIT